MAAPEIRRGPLLPLQRKLEWELEACRGRLGARLQALARATLELQQLQDARSAAATQALASMRDAAHPQAHASALRAIAALGLQAATARRQQSEAHASLAQERARCVDAQRRLETLRVLGWMVQRQQSRAWQRRASGQADALWLARHVQWVLNSGGEGG